ncbi:unnamed protein product [Darwinula stevensoni]|uniref:mitogen-activated protein kinase kinase n=1 Tax=Darwinula stevensoni TaxID=69355 RepID=A0A7R9AD30_9CRUS|nr:unnamed protein product [Darwinula stevensoni]CAG0900648.1 unnamed protein product [Darwinula stevensoni]
MLHKPSRKVIAVKQMRRTGNREETKRILMDLEVVLQSHDCPYIVQCLGCFIRDADVWICMELMATCLDKLIKKLRQPFPEPIIGKVSVATLRALHYLKENHGVIHRDVKPSNILIDEKGCVKLCDFGISARLVESKAKTRNAGCAAYMAPERIEPPDPSKPDYDIRADVWSLGITLVELATGQLPYHDCKTDFEVLTRVLNDDPPRLPEISKFSREFRYFVQDCLTKDYRQRPKYRKLLEYPFIIRYEGVPVDVAAWYAGVCQQIEAHEPHSQVGSGATRGNSPKKLGVSSSGGSPRVAPKPTREVSQMFPSSSNSSSSPSLYRVPLSREPSPLRVGGKPLPSPVVPRRPSRENSPCPSRSALASNASNSGTSVNSPFVRHHSLTRESPHYGQHSHIGGSLRGEPRDWGSYSTDIQQPPSPPRETPPSVVFYPNKNLYVFQRSAPDSSDLLERGASSRLGLLPPRSDNSSSTKRIAGQLLSRFLGRNKPTPNVGSESGKWYLPSPIPSSRRRLSDTASSPTSHPTPFFMRPTYTPEPVRKFH